jgi:pilus assembly protein Flp/PilA
MNLFILKTWLEAKFDADERGVSMIEYALLAALIAIALIAAVNLLSSGAGKTFSSVGSKLNG